MAERSFANEVKALRIGEGQEFHGEGILAVTKGLLQSGVAYVGGYQGAPISHLMDVLGDAQEILDELDIYFENSASEATAGAMLGASVHYPLRGAITFKSTGFKFKGDNPTEVDGQLTVRDITKLRADVQLVAPGSLPNDGKVIEDARSYQ